MKSATNSLLRWIALVPTVAIAFAATLLLIWPFQYLLLRSCPPQERLVEGTTELSQPGYGVTIQSCSASWFPVAEKSLLAAVLLLAVVLAGVVAWRVAPERKITCGMTASVVALLLIVGVFLP
jgi:protein-S-isoprenylcysteine O-methyltransferase Ste14